MKKFFRIILYLVLLFILAVACSVLPSRSRTTPISEGFRYGEPSNQIVTKNGGTFVRKWRGFPATIHETESVVYQGQGYYEASMYEIRRFNIGYVIVNIIFWSALFVAVLAPITIFYRPKKRLKGHISPDAAHTNQPNVTESTEKKAQPKTNQVERADENNRD